MIQQDCPFPLVSKILYIDLWKQLWRNYVTGDPCTSSHASRYRPINVLELQMKKDDLAESAVLLFLYGYGTQIPRYWYGDDIYSNPDL